MIQSPPRNNSGYGRGQYAPPAQVDAYLERMRAYLDGRNGKWLDRWTDPHTGEVRKGIKNLCTDWGCDTHLANWAAANGWIDPRSIPEGGIKNRQIGRYTALVYNSGPAGRRAIAFETERYLDEKEQKQLAEIERKEATCPT